MMMCGHHMPSFGGKIGDAYASCGIFGREISGWQSCDPYGRKKYNKNTVMADKWQ